MNDQQATLSMATSVLMSATLGDYIKGDVLDVGCGNKPYKRLFPECNWTGLDIRPVGDVEGDAHDLPFEDESFHTVLCTEVMHQCFSPVTVMLQLARVLKPGGALVITVPNTHIEDEISLWGIRVRGLDFLLQNAGLTIEQLLVEGRPFLQEWNSNIGYDKFGFESPEVSGFIEHLDKTYPAITAAVAIKPSP